MRNKSLFWIILFYFGQTGNAQNIKEYKYLLKANLSDFVLMGRLTGEVEVPIFKNTSLTGNLGLHYKEYFYDDESATSTADDVNIFHGLIALFPAKNMIGSNLGFGIRQYINLEYDQPKQDYFEIKTYYRWSKFNGKYDVHWNAYKVDEPEQLVTGTQKLRTLYIAWGRNILFYQDRFNIDISVGYTKNFVKLSTCQNNCLERDIGHPAFIYSSADFRRGNFHPRNNFERFRAEVKINFYKKKRE